MTPGLDIEETATQEESLEVGNDLLATAEVEVPPEEPEAHRGEILSVELHTADSGSKSFRVNLRSVDTGRDDFQDTWLPKGFLENIHVDPKTLPDDKGNRQRTSYSIGVSNSKKDATIQALRAVASKAGRSFHGQRPTTIEEFVDAHNEVLAGLEVVYTKRPEKAKEGDDPRFAGRLRVGTIMAQDEAFRPKALRKYKKMWLQEG